ncbi:glycosyltransferase family 2 protein [Luedemannella helvata]|uniref:Glycosyltransferase n=1 Tax=Luedemannella helvata TaxID=349315 RepID=A0ABN2K2Z9_9ACTN
MTSHAVVIPTVGRPSLELTLWSLVEESPESPLPDEVIVVNDRPLTRLVPMLPPALADRTRVVAGPGRGPAAARNVGWRAASADWVVFVDDDVVPLPSWPRDLVRDLAEAAPEVAGVQGVIEVPLPDRPTDWERQVAGLATAPWITADMAVRRGVLDEVGGFDERFPRAYREDTDLALRLRAAGYELARGKRRAEHPVGPAGPWVSVRRQRGNADDALLRRRYGPDWRRLAGAPRGRRPWHAATTVCAAAALLAFAARRRTPAVLAGAAWLALTADFAARRIAPGPRTPREVATMVATSAAIPPAATAYWLRGWYAHRDVPRLRGVPPPGGDPRGRTRDTMRRTGEPRGRADDARRGADDRFGAAR